MGNPTFNNAFSGIHQLVIVPEPSVLLLFYVGALTMWSIHRHRNRARAN